jgi:hypothetical protein
VKGSSAVVKSKLLKAGTPKHAYPNEFYWTVTDADPLAHVLPLVSEAVTVTGPVAERVANPPVEDAKLSIDVSLEVHVAEAA